MTALVLDAEALSLLARGGRRESTVRAALTAALAEGAEVVVPAVLADLYRGGGHDQTVDGAVVAVCAAAGGGVVLTGDTTDLSVLAGGLSSAAATQIERSCRRL